MFASLLAAPVFALSDITINDTDVYPESITVAGGAVILSSNGKPIIYKANAGQSGAEPWIHLTTPGAVTLGVLADPRSRTLWACEIDQDTSKTPPARHTVLRSFDLVSGADKASYPLPGETNLCNDIAIARDGTVYVSDTINGQILRLKSGGMLEVWLKDPMLAGIDGITFFKGNLYVNSVTKSLLLRVPMNAGSAAAPVLIETSQPLVRPDGMRVQGGRMFVAENGAGRVSELKFKGDKATVVVIKEGYVTPTAIEPVGNVLWVCDAKFAYRNDPKLKGQDPNPFKAYALILAK
jgi:hypothetical protein